MRGMTAHPASSASSSLLGPDVIQAAQRSVLCWLATVDAQGQPNVSPKEIFAVLDSAHLVIAHIASPRSVRNVQRQPRVCVSFVDVFVQKGFKILGTASHVSRQEPDFARWAAPLEAMAGPRFPIHGVLVVRASEVSPILAPSYRLYPGETSEQQQVQASMHTYGVRPAMAEDAKAAGSNVQGPVQTLGLVSLVVRDYDEALAFYVGTLGFRLIEDTPVVEQGKRWVVITPPGAGGCRLLLARATSPGQLQRIGDQTGGRVFLFLYTDDLERDHALYRSRGVEFVRPPQNMPYGRVAVFKDLYGNLWDLLQPR
jgi:uncharacterized protein